MSSQVRNHGGSFRMLVGVVQSGDPSRGWNAVPIRQVHDVQTIHVGPGRAVAGRLAGPGAFATGSLTINDADFTTGRVVLRLGPYELVSSIDFAVVDAGGALTASEIATSLAAAINALTGYDAVAALAVVSITCSEGLEPTSFYATHYGTIQNVTSITPATGYLATGGPSIGAPGLHLPQAWSANPLVVVKNAAMTVVVSGRYLGTDTHVTVQGLANTATTVAVGGLTATVTGTMENVAGIKHCVVYERVGGTVLLEFDVVAA